MGFDIIGAGGGFLGAVAVVLGLSVLIIVGLVFFTVAKQARDEVVEDTDHDIEA